VDRVEDLGLHVTTGLNVAVIGAAGPAVRRRPSWLASATGHAARGGRRTRGRARRLVLELAGERHVLDNGQHLLIGAYTATAALMSQVGVALDAAFARRPFEIAYPDGMRMRAARLPAPWHLALALLTARGLGGHDRLALAGFLPRARSLDWKVLPDRSASEWLQQLGQTPRLVERLWRPLTLAALNTPLAEASAQVLATVLRDSLGASAAAAEMWLPRANLSAAMRTPSSATSWHVAAQYVGTVGSTSPAARSAAGHSRFAAAATTPRSTWTASCTRHLRPSCSASSGCTQTPCGRNCG